MLLLQAWVDAHGGGTIIPFSVEFEQKLWELREDPVRVCLFLCLCGGCGWMCLRLCAMFVWLTWF